MGIRLFSADSYPKEKYVSKDVSVDVPPGNPNPTNYKIIDTLTIGNILIVDIQYPDCKNYEGRKILVYEGVTQFELRRQKYIDPHFSINKKFHSPIARFEPTDRGWKMAESFAKMWTMKK
jgi:hypothetical protein